MLFKYFSLINEQHSLNRMGNGDTFSPFLSTSLAIIFAEGICIKVTDPPNSGEH